MEEISPSKRCVIFETIIGFRNDLLVYISLHNWLLGKGRDIFECASALVTPRGITYIIDISYIEFQGLDSN